MLALYIFCGVFIVSLISLVGIFALSFREDLLKRVLFVFVGLAAGALFGDALIHLIPEAFEKSANTFFASLFILFGILVFFILEKFLHWHHSHDINHSSAVLVEKPKIEPLGYLILTSDTVHNFIDGLIIASGFLVSIEVGIATTIAVALHEIPQEIADFSMLIHSGFSKLKALVLNFTTALSALIGAFIVLLVGVEFSEAIPYLSAFAAGGFLYIAGSDLVPEIHKTHDINKSVIQFMSIIVGILIMIWLLFIEF